MAAAEVADKVDTAAVVVVVAAVSCCARYKADRMPSGMECLRRLFRSRQTALRRHRRHSASCSTANK